MENSLNKLEGIKKRNKNRIWELDMLRGFAIIMVFFDHLFYDFAFFFQSWQYSNSTLLNNFHAFGYDYVLGELRGFWRPAFLFIFIFTSGICTAFSRNNFMRGLKLAILAILITFITYYVNIIFGVDSFILFGILHCLALIILIYALVEFLIKIIVKLSYKIAKKTYNNTVYKYALSIVCLILSVVFLIINEKYNVKIYDATVYFDTVATDSKLLGLLFYTNNWWTADYFPLFPFIFFFFFGAGLSQFIYPKKKSLLPCLDTKWHLPFSLPGRYSIFFYLGAQIIALAFCFILSLIFGEPISI
ncbi:MAG: heparan-alpha-glucosaminide N-acetyltransferase domain-containing protein [Clostridia bacterium]